MICKLDKHSSKSVLFDILNLDFFRFRRRRRLRPTRTGILASVRLRGFRLAAGDVPLRRRGRHDDRRHRHRHVQVEGVRRDDAQPE